MSVINKDLFLEQEAQSQILQRVTKYCNNCYKEFKEGEFIYYDTQTFNYLCSECACCKTQEIEDKVECDLYECETKGLF